MEKTDSGSCFYHLCEKTNVKLHRCKYCKKYFCEEHLNAKRPMLAPFRSTDIDRYIEWRKKGHPCPEYAVRPKVERPIFITKEYKKSKTPVIHVTPIDEPKSPIPIKELPEKPEPLIPLPEPTSKPKFLPEPKEYCSVQVNNRFGASVKKTKIELILIDKNFYDNPTKLEDVTDEKGRIYPNEITYFKEGKYVINSTTDRKLSADEIVDINYGKETTVRLWFESITKKGKKIIERKNKKTQVEIKKILEDMGIEKKKPERIKGSISKKQSNPYVNKLKNWFFWKKYPHSEIYKTDLMVQIAFVSCLLFLFMFIYSNSDSLNEINLSIIKLGSTVALILILLLLWYVYKLLKNLRYGFKGLANGYKLITALICVILCFQLYTTPSLVINPVTDFDYGALNPFDIDWDSINISNSDTNYWDDYDNSYPNGGNTNSNDESQSIEEYKTNPKTVTLTYYLHGQGYNWEYTVYKGLNDYLASLPRSISYYTDPPTTEDFIIRDINQEQQSVFLSELVEVITGITDNKDDQARITVSIVQQIPYEWSDFYFSFDSGEFPYEVLYTQSGVCGEKSNLLVFLLRELGFGVAVFEFESDSHRAVGIKCPMQYSYRSTGYCFVETTSPSIITDSEGDYVGVGKLSDYTLITIAGGRSFDSVSEEFYDAQEFNRLNDLADASGGILDQYDYNRWWELVNKYGIQIGL